MKETLRPIIGVITAVACNTGQKELLVGMTRQAMAYGYDTAVFANIYNLAESNSDIEAEYRIYELADSEQLAAVIVDSEAFSDRSRLRAVAERLLQREIPLILAGEQLPELADPRFCCINTDDRADLALLTEHLIREHGLRRIDMLTGPADNSISQRRAEGFRHAMTQAGLAIEAAQIHYGDFWLTSGEALAEQYASGALPLPQAVVCANDSMAFGLLRTFRRKGIRVPGDVAVACYECSEQRIYYPPLLTVCRRERTLLGARAVQMAHALLTGEPLEAQAAPVGELIRGESCGCAPDAAHYHDQLEQVVIKKDYEFGILSGSMEQKLTAAKNMEEFVRGMGDFQWQIRYVDDVFLCLYADWYEAAPGRSSMMSCRSIMPWLDTRPFDAHRLDLAAIFRREPEPAVYYFSPVFFRERFMGHVVLKYNKPDGYDNAFRSWLKSVSNGLEFLRMKNDIQYLLSCQDLSDTRDILTGMYNRNGLKKAFRIAAPHDACRLYFILLRVCITDPAGFTTENRHKVDALLGAAKAVRMFCGDHDIAGYLGDQSFVCLVQSNAEAQLLCSTLTAILIRSKAYMQHFGMDSFCCTAVPCEGEGFDALYAQCAAQVTAFQDQVEQRRSMAHYRAMLTLRNAIYAEPERTFEPFYLDLYDGNPGSVRLLYKKVFGISIHQDCIHARITKAQYYLATTPMSIMEVAERCGYLDHKYFQRQFTAGTGITAGQYRSCLT